MNLIKKIFKPIDLTKGTPWKAIILFAIPIMISTILSNAFSLINSLILKTTVGGDSVTAMNSTGSISAILFNFAYGCTTGFGIIAANKCGEKDNVGLKKAFYNSVFISLIIAFLITVIGLLSYKQLLSFLNIGQQYYEKAGDYYVIILWAFGLILLTNLMDHFINAMGNSTVPLLISIVSTLINIVLGFLLTGVATLDTKGVAIATLVANLVHFILALLYLMKKYTYLRPTKDAFRFNGKMCKDLLWLGLPLGFQWSILFIGSFYQSSRVNLFGNGIATKASSCYGSYENYLTIPLSVMSSALLSYVGQNFGAKNKERIKAGIKACLLIDVIFYAGILIVGLSTAKYVPYIFLPASEVNDPTNGPRIIFYCATYIRIITPSLILHGFLQLSRSVLQGIKKPLIPFFSGIGELIARIFVCFFFPAWFNPTDPLSDTSYIAICFSTPVAWLVSVLIMGGSVIYLFVIKKMDFMDIKKGSSLEKEPTDTNLKK